MYVFVILTVQVDHVCTMLCTDTGLVGCMTNFLAQSLAQNQATLKAIQGMKASGKHESEPSFNWLLTHASVDVLALLRLLMVELLPGVYVCVCMYIAPCISCQVVAQRVQSAVAPGAGPSPLHGQPPRCRSSISTRAAAQSHCPYPRTDTR